MLKEIVNEYKLERKKTIFIVFLNFILDNINAELIKKNVAENPKYNEKNF